MLETLHKFCRLYAQGKVGFWLNRSTVRILKDGDGQEVWEQAAKADHFFYSETRYNRAGFAALMEDAMRPASPTPIG